MQIPALKFNQQIGNTLTTKTNFNQQCDISWMLEDFKCHSVDDHIVDGQNGNEVPPFACSFCPMKGYQHVIAVVDEDGCLILYDTDKHGEQAVLQSWLAHHNAVFDVAWIPGEKKLLTTSGDQTIALWDVVRAEKLLTFNGHTSSVKSLSLRPEHSGVFATGARDGNIMLWDARIANEEGCSAVGTIKLAHRRETTHGKTPNKKRASRKLYQDSQPMSVTAVAFQDENTLISSGATDGTINIWDIRRLSKPDSVPKYQIPYAGTSLRMPGYSYLLLDSSRSRLFASCTDDTLYQFNVAGYQTKPICTYKGHLNSTFYIRTALSPDERFIVSGSSDYHAYIWDVNRHLSSPIQLKGNLGDVTSVAWCPSDITKVVTLSDDSTVKFWRLNRGGSDMQRGYVGRAQRAHRDIGTSVELPSPNQPMSQKVSFTKPEPMNKILSFECTYPTIKAWLANFNKKSPTKANSPKKLASPRKLLISPMKTKPRPYEPSSDTRPKRKLDVEYSPSKRLCGLVTPEKQKLPLSPIKSNTPLTTPATTPLSKASASQKMTFQSPTSDLPNYVLDARVRNPIPGATNKENSTPPCRKGLTELWQRSSPKPNTSKAKTSSPSSVNRTPGSSRGSILFYFSPSDSKKMNQKSND